MTVFRLPDLGEGLSEAEVLKWHIRVGDRIRADEPMLSVETAKAVVEVPAPLSGTITALHAQPGDRIETGAPLVEFAADADVRGVPDQPSAGNGGAATVVGHIEAAAEEYRPEPAGAAAAQRAAQAGTLRPRAIPAARALARQLGIDLSGLPGTGPGGLVTLADVLAHMPGRDGQSAPRAANLEPVEVPGHMQARAEPLRGLRRAMARSMSGSRDEVAACTIFDDADLHAWSPQADYSVRVLRALASAARNEPSLNAWYDAAHDQRLLFSRVDVGVAVDTPEGLLVPVIRAVESLDGAGLRAALDRIKQGAQSRSLPAGELRHCTIMLSNFGSIAGRYATPLVVPPAVAILGTGRARAGTRSLPLSLSFDHRAVTGGEAARFLRALIADLELPQ